MNPVLSNATLTGPVITEAHVDAQVEAAVSKIPDSTDGDVSGFWNEVRKSDLPYLPTICRELPARAHQLCVRALRGIGRHNIGLAYALENHLFAIGGLETYALLRRNSAITQLLDEVFDNELLVANTHGYVHTDRAFTEGISLVNADDGVTVHGEGSFLSLAGEADRLLLSLDGRDPTVLWIPLKDNGAVKLGRPYFPTLLKDSDTRAVRFERTFLPPNARLNLPRTDIDSNGLLPTAFLAWHLSLCTAQFLGGADWLLEQTTAFAQTFKSFDNRPLARLDGIVAEIGQIGMKLAAVEALLNESSRSLAGLSQRADVSEPLQEALRRARVANAIGMEFNEEVARRTRRIIGTRAYNGRYPNLERVYSEILVGPLVPRNNAILERDYGFQLLAAGK